MEKTDERGQQFRGPDWKHITDEIVAEFSDLTGGSIIDWPNEGPKEKRPNVVSGKSKPPRRR